MQLVLCVRGELFIIDKKGEIDIVHGGIFVLQLHKEAAHFA